MYTVSHFFPAIPVQGCDGLIPAAGLSDRCTCTVSHISRQVRHLPGFWRGRRQCTVSNHRAWWVRMILGGKGGTAGGRYFAPGELRPSLSFRPTTSDVPLPSVGDTMAQVPAKQTPRHRLTAVLVPRRPAGHKLGIPLPRLPVLLEREFLSLAGQLSQMNMVNQSQRNSR